MVYATHGKSAMQNLDTAQSMILASATCGVRGFAWRDPQLLPIESGGVGEIIRYGLDQLSPIIVRVALAA